MTENNQPSQGGTSGNGMDPNVASLLCYLCGWLTGLIFLLLEKDNKTVKFHAWQSIIMSVAFILYFIATTILSFVPFLGLIFAFINIFVSLGMMVLVIICMVKAFKGGRLTLPVITALAEKQANA